MATRIVFNQSPQWCRDACICPYSETECCYCSRPVKPDAVRLCLARTNDGEWWLVSPDYVEQEDNSDFGGMFTLPVGPECLRKHRKEWAFAIAPEGVK